MGVRWRVAAGWSIDLFVGERTRDHHDLEIEVPRADHARVRRHLGLQPYAAGDGELRRMGVDDPLPEGGFQSWCFDPVAERWRIDLMAVPGDDDTWVYRRDESLTAPLAWMVAETDDGIPYLRPHGTLLYKGLSSGGIRPKDDADLETCLPRMTADERAWLAESLSRFRPDHPWTRKISGC
ncbi:MAG TPA: hypothetical protein VFU93_04735 [Acidimicrobiales bacterium]|nr:hypothetical protein [Acidimicrobiales bacterium]